MEDKYKIKECTSKKDWDAFVLKSLNKNIFTMWDYIDVENNLFKYFCLKNAEVIAAFILRKSDDKLNIIKTNYLFYTPIIFRDNKNSTNAKKNLEKFEIVNFFCSYLTNNFKSFDITFDTFTNDIRPFLWFGFPNYEKKVITNVRYTSILDLKKIDNENFLKTTFFKNFSNTMRQQYRYSREKKFLFKEYFSKEILMQLMNETFQTQKVEFKEDFYNKILNKLEILNSNGYVRMFCIFNEKEQPINTCIFSIINNSSSYMFSARSKIVDNKNYSGIYLLINCFNYLKKLNVESVDLEGINSPERGFYKIGLGGNIKSYFNLKLIN